MTDIASFQFKDPLTSFNEGYGTGNALQARAATLHAGNALAMGNPQAAVNTLDASGQIGAGQQLQAQTTAATNAQQDRALKFTVGAVTRLQDLHRSTITPDNPGGDVNRTLAAFDSLAPQFKTLAGETDADLAQIRAHIAADPEGTLTALGAGAAKQYSAVQGKDGGIYAFDPGSGTMKTLQEADKDPKPDWKEVKNADGSTHFINLNDKTTWGAGGANPAAKAPLTAAQQDPDAAFLDPSYAGQGGGATPSNDALWASIKQQESGGLKSPGTAVGPDTPYGNALGSTQMLPTTAEAMARKLGIAWNPALMRENSPQALAYQDKIGRAYLDEGLQKYGGDPAKAAMYYFGGPDENLWKDKTHAYAQQVLARAGATGGAPVQPAAGANTLQGGAGGDALPPGAVPGSETQAPVWVKDGKGNLVNRKTGDIKEDKSFVPDVDPNEVKMVLEGRYPAPTTGRAATDPKWQALLAAAAAQDPQFDAANYQTRVKTRQSFLSGPAAQNITALNTVVGHLDALDHSINGLNNTDNLGPLNKINNQAAHFLARQSGTDSRIADFAAKKTAVANELTRVFRGTGGAEADIQGYLKQLDDASSPETLHTTVKAIATLIKSRLDAVADSYHQGMGLSKDPMEFLHPEQQRAFSRLSGVPIPAPGAGAAPAAQGIDPVVSATLQRARAAIAAGKDPDAVKRRLISAGINPADL